MIKLLVQSNKNKRKIKSLSHINNLRQEDSRFRVYKSYLDDIFNNPSLKNIACTGNLGAGKSSIIHSYDASRTKDSRSKNNERFLYVSLIDFTTNERLRVFTNDNETNGSDSEDNANNQEDLLETKKRLEYRLLCQILARCTEDDLVGSTFDVISPNVQNRWKWGMLSISICSIILILIMNQPFSKIAQWIGISSLEFEKINTGLYALLAILLVITFFLLFQNILLNGNLHKILIKVNGAEAEVALDRGTTSLDKYKFEIIYILSQIADKIDNTVVFEDMDRLEQSISIEIMIKLRELNSLLNTNLASQKQYRETSIRFIYALGEETFDYLFRTKFFDCILPIIPCLNYFNSKYLVRDIFRKCEIDVDDKKIYNLITIVAPFLTDYRTILNIQNEYIVFRDLYLSINNYLNMSIDDQATLLSVIIYKAFFPQKYAMAFGEGGQGRLTRICVGDIQIELSPDYKEEFVKMINQLFDLGYLDALSIRMVGMPDTLVKEYCLHILKYGNSESKVSLLEDLIKDQTTDLRFDIWDDAMLEKEKNDQVSYLMAKYLYHDKIQFIKGVISSGKTSKDVFYSVFAEIDELSFNSLAVVCTEVGKNIIYNWCVDSLLFLKDDEFPIDKWDYSMAITLAYCVKPFIDQIPQKLLNKEIVSTYNLYSLASTRFNS